MLRTLPSAATTAVTAVVAHGRKFKSAGQDQTEIPRSGPVGRARRTDAEKFPGDGWSFSPPPSNATHSFSGFEIQSRDSRPGSVLTFCKVLDLANVGNVADRLDQLNIRRTDASNGCVI